MPALVESFDLWLQSRALSASIRKSYAHSVRTWQEWRGQDAPLETTRDECVAFMVHARATLAPGTTRLRLIGLRVLYDYLIETGQVDDNPARSVRLPKAAPKPVTPFGAAEVQAMIDTCDNIRDLAILLLLIGGGLRRAEVFNVTRDDVDFDHGTVRIFGKGSKYRTIAPGEAAISALRAATRLTERLCPRAADDYVLRRLKAVAEQAGIEGRVFPHRMRHTFATRFCEAGGGIDLLQSILGHSSLEMSMHYSKSGREQRALQAQASFNGAITAAPEAWALKVEPERLKNARKDKWAERIAPVVKVAKVAESRHRYERRSLISVGRSNRKGR